MLLKELRARVASFQGLGQARSSHRFEGSNEPPFVRQVSFFSCSLYAPAPCLVITRRLCSSNTEISSNGTVNVCTKAVRWASPRPRLRCDQRRRVHFSSSSIAQRAVCHSRKVLQSTMKRTVRNPTWTDKPSSFPSVLVEGEAAVNPIQTLLLLVHLSRFESLRPRKSRQAVSSKKNNALDRSQSVTAPSSIPGFDNGCQERCGRTSLRFRQARIFEERKRSY